MIQVEFFHDAICSFCFPMSARMRRIVAKYGHQMEVIHRSFALGYTPDDFVAMFGSWEAVKPEVLHHWEAANQNDDEHRFNIEGMRTKDFLFPPSRKPLLAAKAAGLVGGEGMYWDAFDAIQHKLFVENENIAEDEVLEQAIRPTSIPLEVWREKYHSAETEEAVKEDLRLARRYGIHGVPALVINGRYLVSGAQGEEAILRALEQAATETGEALIAVEGDVAGEACVMRDDRWQCGI